MKKFLLTGVAGALTALILMVQPAHAVSITLDLNCVISGGTCTGSASSWGTITLTDNGDSVDIVVDLVGDSIEKVLEVVFNYNDALFSNSTNFTLASDNDVEVAEDMIKLQSYRGFDVETETENNVSEPWTDTISLAGVDLDVSDFLSNENGLYAAVHIGNYGTEPGSSGNNSITVGATSTTTTQVPEPGTLLLLGSGLFGLGLMRRRRS